MKNRGLLNLIQWTDVPKYIKSDLFKVIDSTDDKLKEAIARTKNGEKGEVDFNDNN